MRPPLRNMLERGVARAGYRISRRRPTNRFDAMPDTLRLLRDSGCEPRIVIDGGANVGAWTTMASSIFTNAVFYLIEPQPACRPALERVSASRWPVHMVALTSPGVRHVRMLGGGRNGGSTGAWVAEGLEIGPDEVVCPATTLDELFANRVTREHWALLKLDLEGHELRALRGPTRTLESLEVLLTEVRFYPLDGDRDPIFADLLTFLKGRGFELYDIATLSGHPGSGRLRLGDAVFVRRDSPLLVDGS